MGFCVNYLGHFLLTQLLMPKIKASEKGRIINVSSKQHEYSKIRFHDLNWEKEYDQLAAYG